MVIEFDRNDKRIVLSHTRLWEQEKEEEKQILYKEKKVEAESTKKAVKAIQSKVEKTTLGDLGVLAGLKAKMDNDAAGTESKESEPTSAVQAEATPIEVAETVISEQVETTATTESEVVEPKVVKAKAKTKAKAEVEVKAEDDNADTAKEDNAQA